MDNILLKDPDAFPGDNVLADVLGEVLPVFKRFRGVITDEFSLAFAWNYYRDGSAWLGKADDKKRTIFLVSIWDGCF